MLSKISFWARRSITLQASERPLDVCWGASSVSGLSFVISGEKGEGNGMSVYLELE